MRKIGLISILMTGLLLICTQAFAEEADTTAWYKHAGYTGSDQGNDLAVDKDGSVIVAGQFQQTLAMNPLSVKSVGGNDIFVAKYSDTGEIQFLNRAGGQGNDRAYGVALDSDGNIIIVGALDEGVSDFENTMLTSFGKNDIFVAKYTSDGAFLWAKNFGGGTYEQAYKVAADPDGNIVITGWFYGELVLGADTLKSWGESDIFIAKLSPEGAPLWARRGAGVMPNFGYGVACDNAGATFACGIFRNEIWFSGKTLKSHGLTDMYIVKYDRDGELVWATNFGGELSDRAYAVAVDPVTGNVVLTGYHEGNGSFNNAPETVFESENGNRNILVAALDNDGNLLWGRSEGGPSDDQGRGVTVDDEGFVYITGVFASLARIAESSMKSRGMLDVFMAKYTRTGLPVWAEHVGGGPNHDWGLGIGADCSGNAIVTGHFKKTAFFGGNRFISRGNEDIFLAKMPRPFDLGGLKLTAPEQHFIDSTFSVTIALQDAEDIAEIEVDVFFSNIEDAFAVEDSVFPGSYLGNNPEFEFSIDNQAGKLHIRAKRQSSQQGQDRAFARIVFNTRPTTPFEAWSDFSVENIIARDALGSFVFLQRDEIGVQFVGLKVWPGDTNNDGQVDERDILPIGQFFRNKGSARDSASTKWRPEKVVPWKPLAASYADANGDGCVKQDDLLAVGLNWMKLRNESGFAPKARATFSNRFPQSSGRGDIALQAADFDTTTDAIWVEVAVDSVEDLYGLSFEVHYPAGAFTEVVRIVEGPMFAAPIFFSNNDTVNGVVSIGMSQKGTANGVFGGGVAAKILFSLSGLSSEELLDSLRMEGVTGNDSEGKPIEFNIRESAVVTSVGNEKTPLLPAAFVLYQNTPNPFNPETRISYDLSRASQVQLLIYNEVGQLMRSLFEGFQAPGQHSATWDGRDSRGGQAASGVYFYLLRTEQSAQTRKMLLLR